jgi:hypothetical protein
MKKMMMLILATAIALSAAFVPMDKASTVATNQYKNYCADVSAKGANIVNVVENKYEGQTTWYAFEFEQGGFVIVSADDTVRPILGYSDHGKVTSLDTKGGQNFKEWFNKYDREIAFMRNNGEVDVIAQKTWKDIENNVFPTTKASIVVDALIRSQWDQVWPWNANAPLKGGEETYVGCIATAMVQILRYHQWPDVGVGSSTSYTPFTGTTLPATDFTTHTWNYSLMPEILDASYGYYPEPWYTSTSSTEENEELALQSYWAGLSVNMVYGTSADGGSMANMSGAANALRDHWKGTVVGPSSFSTPAAGAIDGSFTTIKAQLDAGRPWQWAGGAHSFNLDGYRDDTWYHFNWGWWGSFDGWFHRSSLIPGGIGSGGDDGDFTDGQMGLTYTPLGQATFPATTISGSVSGYTVTINWAAQTNATGYMLFARGDDFTDEMELVTTSTGTSHVMTEVPAGMYYYRVKVKYATGESNWSNIYTATVITNPNLNPPMGVNAVVVGRTNIDLTWIAPYAGKLDFYEGFEGSLDLPAGWTYKASGVDQGWLPDQDTYGFVANITEITHWLADYDKMLAAGVNNFFLNSSQMPDGDPAPTSPEVLMWGWLLSPKATMDASNTIKYWGRFRILDALGAVPAQPAAGWPAYDIVSYMGNYTEIGTTRITHRIHQSFVINSVATNNVWDRQESVSLATAATEYTRVGFKFKENVYSTCVDDIIIGSTSTIPAAPIGYQVYRNGSLAATINSGTTYAWTDTAFADGLNSYYVLAVRSPAIPSIKSNYKNVTMDANPKPGFLIGNVTSYTTANLSWYAPYHNIPMWYSNAFPADCDDISAYDGTINMNYRRTVFRAEELGFYYPITLDSIAAGFYNDGTWTTSTFTFRVWLDSNDPVAPTVLYTSPLQTAVHNKITTVALPTPLVINENFDIEIITTAALGTPWCMAKSVINTHSYFKYDDGTGVAYSWGISGGGYWQEYSHMAYIHSSTPPAIAKDVRIIDDGEPRPEVKSGWTTTTAPIEAKAMVLDKPRVIKDITKDTSKAMSYYKIYRDDVYQGQTTSLSWQQTSVPSGDHSYGVAAYYANPTGESAYSEETGTEITMGFGLPPVIGVPATINPTTAPDTSTSTSFNIANTGEAGLHYSMSNAYVGYQAPGADYHTNNFQSGLVYTNSGAGSWVTGTGGTWNGSTTCAAHTTQSTAIMTSPAFSTDAALSDLYLDFDQTCTYVNGSSRKVEYFDGAAWNQIYYVTAAVTGHQKIWIPVKATNTQLRFTSVNTKSGGTTASWRVDNIVVSSGEVPYSWLSFDSPTDGTVAGAGSNTINLTCDAANLVAATYEANITITSDDPINPSKVVNVQFLVTSGGGPIVPGVPNLTTSMSGTNVVLTWGAAADADIYDVYYSADPYGTFTLQESTTNLTRSYAVGTNSKMFYFVKSRNATKVATAPQFIQIAKPASAR